MTTSLGIWAFGNLATRFNPVGYKPELSGQSTPERVRTAVEGLALREARAEKDAVRAYELVYAALGA